jgi:DNA-binding MarR family transcriptional regulator
VTSTRQTSARFLVVHALRLTGMASQDNLADVTGLDPAELSPVLDELVAAGLAKQRTGRLSGYALTADGRGLHRDLLSVHVTPGEVAGVAAAYEAFLPVNGRFKDICTRWQMRPGPDGKDVMNDHADPEYDTAVVGELGSLHAETVAGLAPAVAASERFGRYPARFASALDRVRAGEVAAFARPMSASYHDVWMALHEDFLLTLGREREEADGH